jgi:hypothetical protein
LGTQEDPIVLEEEMTIPTVDCDGNAMGDATESDLAHRTPPVDGDTLFAMADRTRGVLEDDDDDDTFPELPVASYWNNLNIRADPATPPRVRSGAHAIDAIAFDDSRMDGPFIEWSDETRDDVSLMPVAW